MTVITQQGKRFEPKGKLFRMYRNELKGASPAYRTILLNQLFYINPKVTKTLLTRGLI